MTRTFERRNRTAPPQAFGGGYDRGPILPMQRDPWWRALFGRQAARPR